MSEIEFSYEDIRTLVIRGHGSGSLDISPAADPSGTTLSGTLVADAGYLLAETSINQNGDRLRIVFPQNQHSGVEVSILAPEGIALELQTGSGDVTVTVPLGATKVTTGSGDIDLRECADIQASTGSGDIVIGTITGSAGQLNSGSGDISVGSTGSALQAKSASGDLNVLQTTGAVRANTASGDITVPHTSGSVELRSASGDIAVGIADDLPAWLDLGSVSGSVDIDLDASDQPGAGEPYVTVKANTASGDISIYRA